VQQLELPRDQGLVLSQGDVLRAFSAVEVTLPIQRQSKRVRVEGEVLRPSEYVLPEGSSLRDAIRAAGGMTTGAYPFATEFTRVSVQRTQQANYDRALRDMETDFARAGGTQRVTSTEDAANLSVRATATSRLIERLRSLKPSGRIVLQLAKGSSELPDIALEDGDRIYVPSKPTTVGVFGSVFNPASYLFVAGRNVDDYLRLAGGPTKGADEGSIFLVRADGSVASRRQNGGWWARGEDVTGVVAEPGDTLFVPEETDKTTFVQAAKDWTQILYQLGIGLAGTKSAVR
jgi:protein involved in polysaccharide export with SLBB domain